MLATLVDDHGDPAFDGCWDDYEPPSAAERARLDALPHNVDRLRTDWGVREGVALAGHPDTHVFERLWLRPAITVIGIDGHPIAGSSNQIVAEAAARVSVRVGRGQDPARLNEALRLHFERRVPFGLELTVIAARSRARVAHRSHGLGVRRGDARRCARGFGTDPVCMGVGGTIPFVGPFADAFGGIPALLLGPADPSSRIHGEDESLHLGDWHSLIRSEIQLLAELTANYTGAAIGSP